MSLLRRSATTIRTNPTNTAKRQKIDHLALIAFGQIQITLGRAKMTGIKILLDTGSTESHVKRALLLNYDCAKTQPQPGIQRQEESQ
jgi:hypothetical protein